MSNIKRPHRQSVRLTDDEKAHLEQLAEAHDTDKSTFIRQLIQQQKPPQLQRGQFICLPEQQCFSLTIKEQV